MAEYDVEVKKTVYVGEFKNKPAVIKQDADLDNDLKAGTLLYVDADGKMNVWTAETENATPICVLLNDLSKDLLNAGDVTAEVIYDSRLNAAVISAANNDLEITDAMIWSWLANGLDIYKVN